VAEDPGTWGDLEHAIADALEDFDAGMLDPDFYGYSQVATIAHALREGGFINEQNDPQRAKPYRAEGQADAHTLGCPCREGRCSPLSSVRTD
jgi:hypothetical protein